ncbi:MAG: LemA family protein [Verrucomicrobiae bacterium]|nr:LemA family protein [Verrucomicrobiae bacterium]
MKIISIFLAVLVGIFLFGIFSYNRLIGLSQNVDKQWAQVQSVYQRRYDLIPNLVNTVSGAANFEKSTFMEVTQARASVGQININPQSAPSTAQQLAEFEQAQGNLTSSLSRLLAVVENYPDLKASANFQTLQAQLEGSENRIAVERMRFNDAVKSYNTAIKTIPGVFLAGMLRYQERPYFSSTSGAETSPKVEFKF